MSDRGLTHLDPLGRARMVDVTPKDATHRRAVARARVIMQPDTTSLVARGAVTKGDVLAVARVAGIQAAKRTADLIPLCHPLALSKISVAFTPSEAEARIDVVATAKVEAKTGVEMEALTAVSIACLTIYDMVKAAERGMRIEGIRLLSKSGGASGDWRAGK